MKSCTGVSEDKNTRKLSTLMMNKITKNEVKKINRSMEKFLVGEYKSRNH